jgi:hypothetical protein
MTPPLVAGRVATPPLPAGRVRPEVAAHDRSRRRPGPPHHLPARAKARHCESEATAEPDPASRTVPIQERCLPCDSTAQRGVGAPALQTRAESWICLPATVRDRTCHRSTRLAREGDRDATRQQRLELTVPTTSQPAGREGGDRMNRDSNGWS